MTDLTVVPLRRRRPDEGLVAALEQLVDVAKQGKIDRMVCVCTGEDDGPAARQIRYRANSLFLIGALNVTLSRLEHEWDATS